MKPILITTGEPAGIGPDLCLMLSNQPQDLVFLGDIHVLRERAKQLRLNIELLPWSPAKRGLSHTEPLAQSKQEPRVAPVDGGKRAWVWHVPVQTPVRCGQLDPKNSPYVLKLLQLATQACLAGEFAALVTAPVHKGVINQAAIPFTGHTEYFAELSEAKEVVMMLVCDAMRVALVTTHLPLSKVASHITLSGITRVIEIVAQGLRTQFHIPNPRILVAGLNPHAGEGGYLGREEIDIIEPVIRSFQQKGMDIKGPLPADTLFTPHLLSQADAVITMYHDQGLPVLKYAGFGEAVNVTLGLPFVRTSVDHGTALSLAGTGQISVGSLAAAIKLAGELK